MGADMLGGGILILLSDTKGHIDIQSWAKETADTTF